MQFTRLFLGFELSLEAKLGLKMCLTTTAGYFILRAIGFRARLFKHWIGLAKV